MIQTEILITCSGYERWSPQEKLSVFKYLTRKVFHPFDTVLVFCVAILLASAVQSSPIDVDTDAEALDNELIVDQEIAVVDETAEVADEANIALEVEPAPEPEQPIQMFSDDAQSAEKVVEQEEEAAEQNDVHENEVDETIVEVINETSEDEVAVPYQEEKAFEDYPEEVELTEEEKERIIGIEIPLCDQYFDSRVPLHLR